VFRCAGSKPLDLISVDPNGRPYFHECKIIALTPIERKRLEKWAKLLKHPIFFWTQNKGRLIVRIIP